VDPKAYTYDQEVNKEGKGHGQTKLGRDQQPRGYLHFIVEST
jgi:hypothetical protein